MMIKARDRALNLYKVGDTVRTPRGVGVVKAYVVAGAETQRADPQDQDPMHVIEVKGNRFDFVGSLLKPAFLREEEKRLMEVHGTKEAHAILARATAVLERQNKKAMTTCNLCGGRLKKNGDCRDCEG